jgi:multidrug efflux system membrane fusion protein
MAIETRQNVTLVPSAAIQRGAPGTFVFVVKPDQTASVAAVKIGTVEGETTEVQSGLEPGAQVVVDGADKLREGAKVELIDRSGQTAPAAGVQQGAAGADKANGGPRRRSKNGG